MEFVAAEDSLMNAAMDSARATIEQFVARLARPDSNQRYPSLKVRLQEGSTGRLEKVGEVGNCLALCFAEDTR